MSKKPLRPGNTEELKPYAPAAPAAKTSTSYVLHHTLGAISVDVEPEHDKGTLLLVIQSPATGVALHLSPQDAGAIGAVLANWALNHGYRAP